MLQGNATEPGGSKKKEPIMGFARPPRPYQRISGTRLIVQRRRPRGSSSK